MKLKAKCGHHSMPLITPNIPEFVVFILNRLKAAGHQAYIVGGAVRDAFLKRTITDWDVATSAPRDEIRTIFWDRNQFALKHDTVTLVHTGHHFEVTTFRGDEKGLLSDLSHRDFTINAMAFDPDNDKVIDPHGGESDIGKKLIKAVGDPEARFREDPLRLLRGVRLAAELRFRIDEKTINNLSSVALLLLHVVPERIRDELMKILAAPRPSRAFNIMVRTGLLEMFLPELLEGYLKRQNQYHRYTIFKHILETVDHVKPEPILRLTALLHDIAKPRTRIKIEGKWSFYGHEKESALLAEEILNRLRFSNEMIRKVTNLIQHHMIGYDAGWSDAAVRRLIRRVGAGQINNLLTFRRADLLAHGLTDQNFELSMELEMRVNEQIRHKVPTGLQDLAVDGHGVMEVTGLSPGPEVGRILRVLNEKVLDQPELNTREDLMGLLRCTKIQTSP
ncbi:MAG: CCA tRNA nucleotidyltransferase [Desulfobacteraceae bacterium]|nr:CCA tRNA nucleotidyltransferase [Desulfobacteraceae bacterium]